MPTPCRLLPLLVAVLSLPACSSDTGDSSDDTATTGPTTSSTSTPTEATTGAQAEWDECTEISISVSVTQTLAEGPAPEPAGGPIADGTYALTAYEVHGAAVLTSDIKSDVYAFAAPGYQLRNANAALSGTFTTAATTLSLTSECRCNAVLATCNEVIEMGELAYTATPTELKTFSGYINGGTAVATYTLQE